MAPRGCTCGYETGQHKSWCAIAESYPLKQGEEPEEKRQRTLRERRKERPRKQQEGQDGEKK